MNDDNAQEEAEEAEYGHKVDDDPGYEKGQDPAAGRGHEKAQVDRDCQSVGGHEPGQLPDAQIVLVRNVARRRWRRGLKNTAYGL